MPGKLCLRAGWDLWGTRGWIAPFYAEGESRNQPLRWHAASEGIPAFQRMAVVPVSLSSDNCHYQDLALGLGWPESPAADLDSLGDAAIMPTSSESRVTVSGKPSKVVELLRKRLRLKSLKSLETLSLTETELTDSSVETLAGFQSLKSLNLDRSGISPAGIERLKQALPKARISSARMPE
jgi:hypothetical protein